MGSNNNKRSLTLGEAFLRVPRPAGTHTEEPVLQCSAYWGPRRACSQTSLGRLQECWREELQGSDMFFTPLNVSLAAFFKD